MGPPVPVNEPRTPSPSAVTAVPTPPAAPVSSPPPPRDLADIFSDFSAPSIDVAPAAGAVDIRGIRPSRQPVETRPPAGGKEAKAKAKPAPPSHPSRIWVQVATGRNKAALGFDWRRMSREAAEVLRGKKAYTSAWGQTNRLLTGPFPTEAAASSFMSQLRRAGVDGAFLWTSPAGQVVDALAVK